MVHIGVVLAQTTSSDDGFVLIVFAWLILGPVVGYGIGKPKGRAGEGIALGLLLGIIGWLIVALMQPTADIQSRTQLAGTGGLRRPCPHCAEDIKCEATVCRFCGREVEATNPATARFGFAPPIVPANWNVHQKDYDHVLAIYPKELAEVITADGYQPADGLSYMELKNVVMHVRKGVSGSEALVRVRGRG